MAVDASTSPVTFDVAYPEALSRWLWLVKWVLAIPHFILLFLLGIVFYIRLVIAWFVVVFTKKYPEGLFNSNVAYLRYANNVSAYIMLLTDIYPAFGTTPKPESPVTYDVTYPPNGEISRWLTLFQFVRVILMIIQIILLYVKLIVVAILYGFLIVPVILLFTGKIPPGMFDFIVGVQRLQMKIQANLLFMTDVRP